MFGDKGAIDFSHDTMAEIITQYIGLHLAGFQDTYIITDVVYDENTCRFHVEIAEREDDSL